MVLNILSAGPSLILRILTISFCVSKRKASPSISWKIKNKRYAKARQGKGRRGLQKRLKIHAVNVQWQYTVMAIKKCTWSPNILACSVQPSARTWLITSSTVHLIIRCLSLEATESFSKLMAAFSSLRPIMENWLPKGQGNENGVTCWTALSASETTKKS